MDPSLHVALCAALEGVINKALQFDPGSRIALGRLQGQVLDVDITQPAMHVYLCPAEDGVQLLSTFDGEITTRIRGSALALLSLVNSSQINLANSGVEVFGKTGLLIELQAIIHNLDIDWEEAVSAIIGDVAGREVGRGLVGVKQWLQGRKHTFQRLFGEFLTEEIKATPNRYELEAFYQDVDDLRLAVDRASAEVSALRNARSNQDKH